MKRLRPCLVLLVVLLAAAVSARDASAVPAGPNPDTAKPPDKVDPRAWAEAAGGTAPFLVVLKDQADVARAAAPLRAGRDPVAPVVAALRASAAAGQPAVRAHLDALGLQYRGYWIVNALATEGSRAAMAALAARPDVAAVEPDIAFRVPLEGPAPQPGGAGPAPARPAVAQTNAGVEWNVAKIRAPEVWQAGFRGQGIVYANADTGVQWDHPALKAHYRGWDGAAANHNYNWWDAVHVDLAGSGPNTSCPFSSQAPCDDYGHGTHTMGTGVGDDGAGNQIGVAPGAKWIACRNMDRGVGRPSTYIECLQFLMAPTDLAGSNPDPSRHADVISNSYGCPIGPPPGGENCLVGSLERAVDNVRAAGIFMSVSAGNTGSSCSTVTDPPAIVSSVIVVGNTDGHDIISATSSRGPVTIDGSGRRAPNLSAPGTNVRSSVPGNAYTWLTGTSMAAPHVAGAVALLWSAYPGLRGQVGVTEQILETTAVHLTSSQRCGGDAPDQVPNNVYGYGRIDALEAYRVYRYLLHFPVYYYHSR